MKLFEEIREVTKLIVNADTDEMRLIYADAVLTLLRRLEDAMRTAGAVGTVDWPVPFHNKSWGRIIAPQSLDTSDLEIYDLVMAQVRLYAKAVCMIRPEDNPFTDVPPVYWDCIKMNSEPLLVSVLSAA